MTIKTRKTITSQIRERARALLEKEKKRERDLEVFPVSMHGRPENSKNETSAVATGDNLKLRFGRFAETEARNAYVIIPDTAADNGEEICRLTESLGLRVVHTRTWRTDRRVASTFIGSGTIEQLKQDLYKHEDPVVIIDAKLSPGQVRNLEDALEKPVLDRKTLILAIFKRNAKSAVSKLQVELAELQILKSRLAGVWEGLSRQRGAAGGKGGRGLGESRLELDRRVVKRRTEAIKRKLEAAERSFETQSKSREGLPRVALVGYTNAGKSTVMNLLTGRMVLSEDRLFATLDTTVSAMHIPDKKILISDTVGFVRDLPPELVASFKSTLLEAIHSTLILIVIDASAEAWREHLEVTLDTLEDIGADEVPHLYVFNQIDKLSLFPRIREAEIRRYLQKADKGADFVMTSAKTGAGIDELKSKIIEVTGNESAPQSSDQGGGC